MAITRTQTLLRPGDSRWQQINHEQDAERDRSARTATIGERLDRGVRLSRVAGELRRAAWKAQHSHPAT